MPILNDFTDLSFQSFILYLIFHLFAYLGKNNLVKNFSILFLVVSTDLVISDLLKSYLWFSQVLPLASIVLVCIIYLFNQLHRRTTLINTFIIAYTATELAKAILSMNGRLLLYWLAAIILIIIIMLHISQRVDSTKNKEHHFCLLCQFLITLLILFILSLLKINFSDPYESFIFLKENLFFHQLSITAILLLISFIFHFPQFLKHGLIFLTTTLINLIFSYFIISTDNFFLFIYINIIIFLTQYLFKNIFCLTFIASYLASSFAILLSLFTPISLVFHDPSGIGNLILILFESLVFTPTILIGLLHLTHLILTKRYQQTYQTLSGAICTYSLIIFMLFLFYQPFTNYFNTLANINDKKGHLINKTPNQDNSLTFSMEDYQLTYYWHAQERHFSCKPNYEVAFKKLPFTPENFIACLLDETKPENWQYWFDKPIKMELTQYPFTLKNTDPFAKETKQRITNHILENKEIFLRDNRYSIEQLIQWKLHIEQRLTKTKRADNLILTYRDLYLTNEGYNLAIRAQLRSLQEKPIQYSDCSYPSEIEIIMLFKDVFITEYLETYVLGLTDKEKQCQQIPFNLYF